jgi:glyoxylase-like metal-dependent hydrolase (beta-lactamase superfamily II)
MTIRFLNCGTNSPFYMPNLTGTVVILLETNQGLTLIDSGLGVQDYAHLSRKINLYLALGHFARDPNEAAIHQLKRLGYDPVDVRHVIMTHLHFDHAGGLRDFPQAQVHIYKAEYEAMLHPRGWLESYGFLKEHFVHHPRWVVHAARGEKWYDFDIVRLDGFEPKIFFVPLPGHTRGHCGVVIKTTTGWHFHVADAAPVGVAVEKPDIGLVGRLMMGPYYARLFALGKAHPEITITGSHMESLFFEKRA